MKPFNYKAEQRKKWILTTVLLGSLGFNLSMNPEHFNNIVRNDINSGVFELAATSDEAAKAETDRESARFASAAERKKQEAADAAKKAGNAPKATVSGSGEVTPDAAYKSWSDDGKKEAAAKKAEIDARIAAAYQEYQRSREEADKMTREGTLPPKVGSAGNTGTSQEGTAGKPQVITRTELEQMIAEKSAGAATKAADEAVRKAEQRFVALLQEQEKARAARNEAQLPAGSQPVTAAPAGTPAGGQKPATPTTETGTGQATNAPVAAAPGTTPAPTRDYVLNNSKDLCRATFKKADGKVVATVDKASDAMPCSSKGDYDLKSAFADIAALGEELKAKLTKEEDKTAKAEREKEEKKEKIAALKEKYEGLVKSNCSKKGMEYTDRLECVQNLASELSDKLDDSNASKLLMKSFLGKYVIPRIKEGMVAQTITYDAWGRPVDNYDNQQKLVAANDSAMYLLEHLNSDNSDSWVVQQLAQTRNAGYNAQIGYARDMYLQAQEDKKDPMRFQLGVIKENIAKVNLNPFMLNGTLARDRMDWTNALNSGDKGQFQNALGSSLFTPVQSLISRLPKWDTYGKLDANKQDMAAVALATLNIDSFGLSNGGLPFTPGTGISGIPTGLTLESRLKAQDNPRTNGLADIMTARGTTPGSITGARGAAQKLGSPATGTQYRGRTAVNQ